MSTEKIKAKDMTEFEGPIDAGDPHGKRPADKRKVGDIQPDESVAKSKKQGAELPTTTNVAEEVASLFGEVEGLSEDFVTKASTLFEGAISEKIEVIREQLEAEYSEKLDEAYETLSEDLEGKIDSYLNLFVETYMKDNALAIEKGFRSEITEQVVASIVSIVESAGVELPEDKIDIAEALVSENEELEDKYNKVIAENIELAKTVRKFQIDEAFRAETDGLTEASRDKLRRLTENMEFSSVEQFVTKLGVLKESFSQKPTEPTSKRDLTEATEAEKVEAVVDPRMAGYIAATRGSYL